MENKMRWTFPTEIAFTLKSLVAVGVLVAAFLAGTHVNPASFQPQTTTVIKPGVDSRLVERHTVQYIEKPVTVVKNIERVVKIPAELRNFSDLEELEQWLAGVEASTTTLHFESADWEMDCDDYALDLQRRALADGYILSFEVIDRDEYNTLFENELPPAQSLHAINLAIIGNSAYYIEPQTDEIVFVAHLD